MGVGVGRGGSEAGALFQDHSMADSEKYLPFMPFLFTQSLWGYGKTCPGCGVVGSIIPSVQKEQLRCYWELSNLPQVTATQGPRSGWIRSLRGAGYGAGQIQRSSQLQNQEQVHGF